MFFNNDKKIVDEALERGVEEFIDPKKEGILTFKEKLVAKSKGSYSGDIIIKFGIDPTKPDIHLGHAVVFRKLKKLQEEFHCKIVFLIGDFTAQIGDPTGKSKIRPELQVSEVINNLKTYLDQIQFGNFILKDEKHFSWITNSDWFVGVADVIANNNNERIVLGKIIIEGKEYEYSAPSDSLLGKTKIYEDSRLQLKNLHKSVVETITLRDLLAFLRKITYAQLKERDMFQERIKKGGELYMHEMLYPVLQGLDSHILAKIYGSCDLEIGGTDQTFNMLMGRDVMRAAGDSEQAVLSMKILRGTDGKEKMSKSLNNYIGITEAPNEMFGKIMSIPDDCIKEYLELCTDLSDVRIGKIMKMPNPKDQKVILAKEIVTIYHSKEAADKAEKEFNSVFSNKELPSDIETFVADKKEYPVLDLLCDAGLASSKTEAKRLIEQGAIVIIIDGNEEKMADWKKDITITDGMIVRRGSRQFKKIILT